MLKVFIYFGQVSFLDGRSLVSEISSLENAEINDSYVLQALFFSSCFPPVFPDNLEQ